MMRVQTCVWYVRVRPVAAAVESGRYLLRFVCIAVPLYEVSTGILTIGECGTHCPYVKIDMHWSTIIMKGKYGQ